MVLDYHILASPWKIRLRIPFRSRAFHVILDVSALNILAGFAPVRPADFVIRRILQMEGHGEPERRS